MPKIQYKFVNMRHGSLAMVKQANDILDEYRKQGFSLTLRQLYYQFVARDLFPVSWADKTTGSTNNQRSYKNLGNIINDGRLRGLVDWTAIVDRTRELEKLAEWDSPADIMRAICQQYREDLWADQPYRIEVWVEKDALAGTIEPVCNELRVPYLSCRGYTSQSEMWLASQRLRLFEKDGQKTYIIHLGDHDPSGRDMSRDIQDRMGMFECNCEFLRIALNMDQIRRYDPPPNPAKITDSRATKYIEEFGRESWELDALEPSVIADLIRKAVKAKRNEGKWSQSVKEQERQRGRLATLAATLVEDGE